MHLFHFPSNNLTICSLLLVLAIQVIITCVGILEYKGISLVSQREFNMGGGNTEAQHGDECRKELRRKYREFVLLASPDQRARNREDLTGEVIKILALVPLMILRCCQVSSEVYNKNKEDPDWHFTKASKGLIVIEKFALNLWDYPWKKELRTIKQYTGLYQAQIARNLKGSESYFGLMGYQVLRPKHTLQMDQVDKEKVADGAFDTFFDAVCFKFLGDVYNLVCGQGYTPEQVWQACREKFTGTPEEVARQMVSGMKPGVTEGGELKTFRTEVPSPIKPAVPERKTEPKKPAASGRDSGYVSKPVSREIPQSELEEIKRRQTEQSNRSAIDEKNLSKQLGSLLQKSNDEPATIDEHVDMSLKALRVKNNDIRRDLQTTKAPTQEDSWTFLPKFSEGEVAESGASKKPRSQYLKGIIPAMPVQNGRFPEGKSNDLWAPMAEDRKPLPSVDPMDENSSKVQELLETAKAPQQTQIGFSTFGKDNANRHLRGNDNGYYTSRCNAPSFSSFSPLFSGVGMVGGDVQSDCANVQDEDKVDQLLRETDKELDETIQRPIWSSASDYRSLPSAVPLGRPELVARSNATENLSVGSRAKPRMTSPGMAVRSPTSGPWQCKACTYINNERDVICSTCKKSRDVNPSLTSLRSGTPQCPQCTLVNREGARKCEVCEAPLKGCPTYF